MKQILWLLAVGVAGCVLAGFSTPAQAQEYTYDAHGRLETATYASGKVVTYCYDDAGNRTRRVVGTSVVSCSTGSSNNPPNAVNDLAFTNPFTLIDIFALANDSDPDSDPLTITSLGTVSPTSGSVSINSGGGSVSFSASADGTYTFTYTISDGNFGTDTATITVEVFSSCGPGGC